MKALFELFRRFDARRIFGFIRRLGGHVISKSQVLRFAFYPRPPGGGRPVKTDIMQNSAKFLSTPSGWRATHHLRRTCPQCRDFYPRPPGGGRHPLSHSMFPSTAISIHALRVEGDAHACSSRPEVRDFYPRPPGGGRLEKIANDPETPWISIHALRVEGDSTR